MTTSTEPAAPATPATHGKIGLPTASALYIAAVLGTGMLVLPGLAADVAGPASVVAVAAVLLLSIPLASTFAALAARYPDAGGVATFVRLALGDTAARASGYWFFFGVGFGAPVVAALGGEYLVAALGADHSLVPYIGITFLAATLGLAAFGLRVSGSVQLVLTGLLIVVVVLVVASSGSAYNQANFEPFLPHGWAGVATAVSLFVWAFAGWEAVTHIAAEFKNPRRIIPLATAIAIVVVGVAYLALQFVTVGVLGATGGSSACSPHRPRCDHHAGRRADHRRGHRRRRRGRGAQRRTFRRSPTWAPPSAVTGTCRSGSRRVPSRARCRAVRSRSSRR